MAVRVKRNDEETTAEYEDADQEFAVPIRNKTRVGSPRMVLVEDSGELDEDVPHSGVVENGVNIYDKLPIRGGMIINTSGEIVNHLGQEIDPTNGNVINPERYKDQGNLGLG